jgi:hypothetical protein
VRNTTQESLQLPLELARDHSEVLSVIHSRRHLIQALAATTAALQAAPFALGQFHPSPNAPNPNAPHRIGDPEPTVGDKRAVDPQNLTELRHEVEKLQDLVNEVKEELDHTNPNTTLSVGFVKKTQQIEKLAKQVKDRAKA